MGAIKGKKLEVVTCPVCKIYHSKRLTNFEAHLKVEHSITAQKLWDRLNNGPKLCGCGCLNAAPWRGWKAGYGSFIIGHNASVYSSYPTEVAAAIIDQRSRALKGKTGWAKGLTKANDERIKQRSEATSRGRKAAFDKGTIVLWNKGSSAAIDERVKKAAEDAKAEFAAGLRKVWSTGLTTETDPRLLKKAIEARESFATGRIKAWHAGKTVVDDPRIAKFWANRDSMAEYSHIRWSNVQIETMLESNVRTRLERITSYKNDRSPALDMCCRTCNWRGFTNLNFARTDTCPVCAPKGSKAERILGDWLEKELGSIVGRNVRGLLSGKQELDVFSPAHKLAIEFNGLYWHSEAVGRDHNYHQQKSDRCRANGISLIHIYEDEWRDRPDIIMSMIRHRINKSSLKLGARECELVELAAPERREFFNSNHIDGDVQARRAIGLRHPIHGLVTAMSFREPFHQTQNASLEVARMATATNTVVAGGLSRLTKKAVTIASEEKRGALLSYIDTRFGTAGSWITAGWTVTGETPPRFWWTDFRDRYNRFRYRADKNRGLSEADVANEAGVVKIYGCKNLTLGLKLA